MSLDTGLSTLGTWLFGLAYRPEPLQSESKPFQTRDVPAWRHFGHDISVHKQLTTFVYLNV